MWPRSKLALPDRRGQMVRADQVARRSPIGWHGRGDLGGDRQGAPVAGEVVVVQVHDLAVAVRLVLPQLLVLEGADLLRVAGVVPAPTATAAAAAEIARAAATSAAWREGVDAVADSACVAGACESAGVVGLFTSGRAQS